MTTKTKKTRRRRSRRSKRTSTCSRPARKTISRRRSSGSPNRPQPSAKRTAGTHCYGPQVTVTKRWLGFLSSIMLNLHILPLRPPPHRTAMALRKRLRCSIVEKKSTTRSLSPRMPRRLENTLHLPGLHTKVITRWFGSCLNRT